MDLIACNAAVENGRVGAVAEALLLGLVVEGRGAVRATDGGDVQDEFAGERGLGERGLEVVFAQFEVVCAGSVRVVGVASFHEVRRVSSRDERTRVARVARPRSEAMRGGGMLKC